MRTFLKAALPAVALAIGSAGSVRADDNGIVIRDSRNQIIGTSIELEYLAHRYDRGLYVLNYDRTGLHINALFYFVETVASNCTGQKYLDQSLDVPPLAVYDGAKIWAEAGPSYEQLLPLESYEWAGVCWPLTHSRPPVAPAVVIDPNPGRWVPIFSSR